MPVIVELIRYPIKGCAGVPVREAVLAPAGLAHDRSFMVVAPDGTFRSQRRDPRLALVRPEVGGGRLMLRAPGAEALDDEVIEVDASGARREVSMFGRPYRGIDQGEAAAGWLSEVLGAPSRLVRVPPEHDRVTDGLTPGTAGYADSGAVHLTSRSSLGLLNERIAERGGEPLPMSRFRPNVVVAGWPEPHTEARARHITIGEAELAFAKYAVRCAVCLVDQESGTRAGPEPIRTLAAYRRGPEGGGVTFGVKLSVLRPGKLSVGDEVLVEEWER
jgi:uncharacterized protein